MSRLGLDWITAGMLALCFVLASADTEQQLIDDTSSTAQPLKPEEAEQIRRQLNVLIPLVDELQYRLMDYELTLPNDEDEYMQVDEVAPEPLSEQEDPEAALKLFLEPEESEAALVLLPGQAEPGATLDLLTEQKEPEAELGLLEILGMVSEETQTDLSPQTIFQQALEAFSGEDWFLVSEYLSLFLEQWPEHRLVPGAYYRLSVAEANLDNIATAQQYLDVLISTYSDHYLVPDAIFFSANLDRTNQPERFRTLMNKLIENYPDTGAAVRAKALLQQ